MLRNILIASLLFCASVAGAQNKKTTTAAEPKTAATPIDYQHPGAPMPHIMLVTLDTVKETGHKNRKRSRHKVADTADYQLTSYGAKMYTDSHFDNGASLIVMMFNPTCGHCEHQADMIATNSELFKKTKVILLANQNMKAYLPDFIKNHHIADYPIFTLGVDSADFIKETFLYQMLPQINIYSKEHKLVKTYTGSVSIDSLTQYAE